MAKGVQPQASRIPGSLGSTARKLVCVYAPAALPEQRDTYSKQWSTYVNI